MIRTALYAAPHAAPRAMQGASLVTAIFLLVVLSGLAVAMVTLTTNQQVSAGLDAQGARAYLAARAGIEVGVFQVTRNNGACKTDASGEVSENIKLPSGPGMAGFAVNVVCRRTQDAVTGQQRYTVQATACNDPSGTCPNPSNSIDYVQRVLHAEFSAPGEP